MLKRSLFFTAVFLRLLNLCLTNVLEDVPGAPLFTLGGPTTAKLSVRRLRLSLPIPLALSLAHTKLTLKPRGL